MNLLSYEEVLAALQPLTHSELLRLAKLSGVSFSSLWRMRTGKQPNPGVETVRKFIGLIDEVRRPAQAEA